MESNSPNSAFASCEKAGAGRNGVPKENVTMTYEIQFLL